MRRIRFCYDAHPGIRHEAETAGVRGVPSLVTEDRDTHWGMGGLERLLEGRPVVPRTV
jgi:hypothetical protein